MRQVNSRGYHKKLYKLPVRVCESGEPAKPPLIAPSASLRRHGIGFCWKGWEGKDPAFWDQNQSMSGRGRIEVGHSLEEDLAVITHGNGGWYPSCL